MVYLFKKQTGNMFVSVKRLRIIIGFIRDVKIAINGPQLFIDQGFLTRMWLFSEKKKVKLKAMFWYNFWVVKIIAEPNHVSIA